jgi:biopolymer transport protein ExbD
MRKPSRARERRRRQTEVNQELELMPMLNVFISIIPLLLLSAAFVQLAVIPTALPAPSDTPPAAVATDVEKLSLTIAIGAGAYVVEANGTTVGTITRPEGLANDDARARASREELGRTLAAIAARFPEQREVTIAADPTTHYEDIIDVMDVSRGAGLPEAALAD